MTISINMILYNVTVTIEDDVHEEWLSWMKEIHIPDVMATGFFVENKLMRIMTEDYDGGGFTYAIQYFCDSINDYNIYQEKFAPELQVKHTEKYKGKFVAHRTIMKVIE